ncbi:hypothetical protein D3C87_2063760 [compost metagenome]
MELNTFHIVFFVAKSHNLAFLGLGCNLEAIWQCIPFNKQRVIASRSERCWKTFEYRGALVANR